MEETTIKQKCYCCKAEYIETDKFCGSCGYPFQGTPEEQKQFSINYSLNVLGTEDAKDRVKEVRIVLYAISIFTVIYSFINYAQTSSIALLLINFILAAIYVGLAVWSKQKAFAAIFTGGLIYISIILLNAILEPLSIFNGIIFKVIFIIAFIKASYGAYKYKV